MFPASSQDQLGWRRIWVVATVCAACVAVNAIVPPGIASGIVFVALVLCAFWSDDGHAAFVFAAIGSVLALAAALLKNGGAMPRNFVFANCALSVAMIWLVATMVFFLRRMEVRMGTLASIVDQTQDAVASVDLDGTVRTWNGSAERMYGYSAAEVIGRNIVMLFPASLINEEDLILGRIRAGERVDHYETTRVRKDGSSIEVSLSVSPIRDQSGLVVGASKIARDISARRNEERQFRTIVDTAPTAILMVDRAGVIRMANRGVGRLFGRPIENLMGANVETLIPERFRARHSGHFQAFFAAPRTLDSQERRMASGAPLPGLHQNGNEIPLEITLVPVHSADEPMVMCWMVDVTEREKLDEERQRFRERLEREVGARTKELRIANTDLLQFAFVASHDLKAPLRVVDNATKWLEEDLEPHLTEETRATMKLVRGRVRRMERLLDDLLEYSRIGRKPDAHFAEPVTGREIIQDMLQLLCPPSGFVVRATSSFDAFSAMRMPLQQILLNLVGNAIKHHDRGNGLIEIDAQDRGENFVISVRDDGPGIPKEYHEEVFKMFTTLKPRDQLEGSGMGLAIVRRSIEAFGGQIELKSGDGRGSLFSFTWPKRQRIIEEAA